MKSENGLGWTKVTLDDLTERFSYLIIRRSTLCLAGGYSPHHRHVLSSRPPANSSPPDALEEIVTQTFQQPSAPVLPPPDSTEWSAYEAKLTDLRATHGARMELEADAAMHLNFLAKRYGTRRCR